jgi:DNA-binding XRE family transcriptional regulator
LGVLSVNQANLYQTFLAHLAGVDRKSISNWESGRNAMSLVIAVDLAAALGCTLDDLTLDNRADKGVN